MVKKAKKEPDFMDVGLLSEGLRPEDTEHFLRLYKNMTGEWTLNGTRLAHVWQPVINSALEELPIPASDYIDSLGKIVNYMAYGAVRVEEHSYMLVRILETTKAEEKSLAEELYCRYIERGNNRKAAAVREKYNLKINETKNPCGKHANAGEAVPAD